MTLTPPQARELVRTSLLRIVPDADLEAVGDAGDLRDALELDSLDFLGSPSCSATARASGSTRRTTRG